MNCNLAKTGKKLLALSLSSVTLGALFVTSDTNLKEANALGTEHTNREVLEFAKRFDGWSYGQVDTCTGLVVRTLGYDSAHGGVGNATSRAVVGRLAAVSWYNVSHAYPDAIKEVDNGQNYIGNSIGPDPTPGDGFVNEGSVLTEIGPDTMLANANALVSQGNPGIQKVYEGPINDNAIKAVARPGDLVLATAADMGAAYGHAAIYAENSAGEPCWFGANASTSNPQNDVCLLRIGRTYGSGIQTFGVGGASAVHIFRFYNDVEPTFNFVKDKKTGENTYNVDLSIHKTDKESGKNLEGVSFDFYMDGEKVASGVSDKKGNISVTIPITDTIDTGEIKVEYVENWDELTQSQQQDLFAKGYCRNEAEAQEKLQENINTKYDELLKQFYNTDHKFTAKETGTDKEYVLGPDTSGDASGNDGEIEFEIKNDAAKGQIYIEKYGDALVSADTVSDEFKDSGVFNVEATETEDGKFIREYAIEGEEGTIKVEFDSTEAKSGNYKVVAMQDKVVEMQDQPVPESMGLSLQVIEMGTDEEGNTVYAAKLLLQGRELSTMDNGVVDVEDLYEGLNGYYINMYSLDSSAEDIVYGKESHVDVRLKNDSTISETPVYFRILEKQVDEDGNLKAGRYNSIDEDQNFYLKVEELTEDGYNVAEIHAKDGTLLGYYKNGAIINIPDLEYKDSDKASEIGYAESPLEGAVFGIYANQDILDPADGEVLYKEGALMDIITTDDCGQTMSKELPLGKYFVQEIKAPEGYVLDDTKHEVELKYEDNQTRVVFDGASLINKRQKISLNVTKQNSTTNEGIAGAVFAIYADENIKGAPENVCGRSKMSSSSAMPEEPDVACSFIPDAVAESVLLDADTGEDETTGEDENTGEEVQDNEDAYKSMFTLVQHEDGTYAYVRNDEIADTDVVVDDEFTSAIEGMIGSPVEDEDFVSMEDTEDAFNKLGTVIEKGELLGIATSDENGQVTFDMDLPLGDYVIKEVKAPEHYKLSTEEIKVDADYQGQDIATIELESEYTNEYEKSSIQVTKVDEEGNTITDKDFEFGIYSDEQGKNLIKKEKGSDEGIVTFEDLDVGTYYIKETKAPEGYQLSDEVVKAELLANGKVLINGKEVAPSTQWVYDINYENEELSDVGTATSGTNYMQISAMTVVIGGLALLVIRKKVRN